MTTPVKQHLIDPEICIRCYTCEMTCPIGAIEHDDNNVVVNADVCNFCMDCIPVCPTGSIDEWRVVETPYTLEEQYEFDELPEVMWTTMHDELWVDGQIDGAAAFVMFRRNPFSDAGPASQVMDGNTVRKKREE